MRKVQSPNIHLRKMITNLKQLSNKNKVNIWRTVAEQLSRPTRISRRVNLAKLEAHANNGEVIIVPGKVLGTGDLTKKITVSAWRFSDSAFEKINKVGKAISIEELMNNDQIIRNRLKIKSSIHNAQVVLKIQEKFGSLDSFLWQFSNGMKRNNSKENFSELPTESDEYKAMSNALKKMGFKFVGPTICYAFMQAVGMVNDHLIQCFRHLQIEKLKDEI